MKLFNKKKTKPLINFNPEEQKAIIKCSICNGEQVAGFKDLKTGKFTEVMLINNEYDLNQFKKEYSLDSVPKEY